MNAPVRDLALASFPHQLLHALASLRHQREHEGRPVDDEALLLVWSHQPREHRAGSRFRHQFAQLLQGFPWVRLVFPGYVARQTWLSPHLAIRARVRALARHLGPCEVERCYYAHDASADHTAQVLLQWQPHARAICYGDPPGFLYPAAGAEARRKLAARWLAREPLGQGSDLPAWREASLNLVAVRFPLPAGVAGAVQLVPRPLYLDTLASLRRGLPQLASLQRRLLASLGGRPATLLVLSNFTESRLTRREDELALYRELLQAHAPAGGLVLLKPHAGTTPAFLHDLQARLSSHRLQLLPPELRWLPVELLDLLLQGVTVLSVSSSSVLLSYLYGGDRVRHGLTGEAIDRWFRPEVRADFRADNAAILHVLAAPDASFQA